MLPLERHSVRYCLRGTLCVLLFERYSVYYRLRDTVCVTVWEKQCVLLLGTGRGAFHST